MSNWLLMTYKTDGLDRQHVKVFYVPAYGRDVAVIEQASAKGSEVLRVNRSTPDHSN